MMENLARRSDEWKRLSDKDFGSFLSQSARNSYGNKSVIATPREDVDRAQLEHNK
jgi:hypothetical protein